MNNAFITKGEDDTSVLSREKVETLTETIEALQNIANSSYWKVLQNNIFDVELAKSKRRIEHESDTTEIFRLQGEIKLGRRYHLDKMLSDKLKELSALRKQT